MADRSTNLPRAPLRRGDIGIAVDDDHRVTRFWVIAKLDWVDQPSFAVRDRGNAVSRRGPAARVVRLAGGAAVGSAA